MPFNAPGKGKTDIEELVLVCQGCHHEIHDNNLTLEQHPVTGLWSTRPARPDEIAPRRPSERPKSGSPTKAPAAPQRAGRAAGPDTTQPADAHPRQRTPTQSGKTSSPSADSGDDDH